MYLLKAKRARETLETDKGKLWIKKEALKTLDEIVILMLKDMAQTIQSVHEIENRRRATVEDIKQAYYRHKEKHNVQIIETIVDKITLAAAKEARKLRVGYLEN